MTKFTIKKISCGKNDDLIIGSISSILIFIAYPFFIFFRLMELFGLQKSYSECKNEPSQNWINLSEINLVRKKVAVFEISKEEFIYIYELSTKELEINKDLKNKLFGEFYFKLNNIIFLREYTDISLWSKSRLVAININEKKLLNLMRLKSSNNNWHII